MGNFDLPFENMLRQYRRFRQRLTAEVSVLATNEFKENFRRRGYMSDQGLKKWKPRAKDKKAGRAILVASGRLKRSLRPAPTYNDARVVTDVPYAQVHNEGGKAVVKVRAHNRRKFSKTTVQTLTKSGKKRNKTMKAVSGKTKVKAHKRKQNIVARPFMLTTAPLLRKIDHHVETELHKIFEKA